MMVLHLIGLLIGIKMKNRSVECVVEFVPVQKRKESLLREFSEKFREVFANPPYNQFLLNKKTKQGYSPQEVFGTDDYVEIDQLNSFDTRGSDCVFWLDPEKTFQILLSKLKKRDSFLTIIKDSKNNEILGGTLAYLGELNDIFHLYEEWNDPYLYSSLPLDSDESSIKKFTKAVEDSLDKFENNVIKLTEKTKFMVWNCVFLSPFVRGRGAFYDVMGNLAQNLPQKFDTVPLIAEVIKNTKAEKLFKPAKFVETSYELEENHPVIIQKTKNFKQIFLPPDT